MNTQVINGGDLMLFLGGKTLAFSTSHKLTINVETAETSSKDSGGKWKTSEARKMSWTVSSENLYIEKGDTAKQQDGFGDAFDLLVARQPVEVMFTLAVEAAEDSADSIPASGWAADEDGKYSGKAIITSLEANATNGDNATFSVQLEGVGELKHTPIAIV